MVQSVSSNGGTTTSPMQGSCPDLRGAMVDEVRHHRVAPAAQPKSCPMCGKIDGAAVGEVPLQVGEVRDGILRVGAADEREHRHAAGRGERPERARLGALRDGGAAPAGTPRSSRSCSCRSPCPTAPSHRARPGLVAPDRRAHTPRPTSRSPGPLARGVRSRPSRRGRRRADRDCRVHVEQHLVHDGGELVARHAVHRVGVPCLHELAELALPVRERLPASGLRGADFASWSRARWALTA